MYSRADGRDADASDRSPTWGHGRSDPKPVVDRQARCAQEHTSHTDNVGRLRETTLRRSPLRHASDWRQDIATAPAALRMTSSTTSGFDNMGTWDAVTSVVAAFMRFETERCRSG